MTIDKQKLKALTDRVKTDRRFCADENHHALADGVQALLAEIEENAMHMRAFGEVMRSQAEQIGKLKAENEALRGDAERMGKAADFVQQLRNAAGSQPSVATGYLDDILSAMSKEPSHD